MQAPRTHTPDGGNNWPPRSDNLIMEGVLGVSAGFCDGFELSVGYPNGVPADLPVDSGRTGRSQSGDKRVLPTVEGGRSVTEGLTESRLAGPGEPARVSPITPRNTGTFFTMATPARHHRTPDARRKAGPYFQDAGPSHNGLGSSLGRRSANDPANEVLILNRYLARSGSDAPAPAPPHSTSEPSADIGNDVRLMRSSCSRNFRIRRRHPPRSRQVQRPGACIPRSRWPAISTVCAREDTQFFDPHFPPVDRAPWRRARGLTFPGTSWVRKRRGVPPVHRPAGRRPAGIGDRHGQRGVAPRRTACPGPGGASRKMIMRRPPGARRMDPRHREPAPWRQRVVNDFRLPALPSVISACSPTGVGPVSPPDGGGLRGGPPEAINAHGGPVEAATRRPAATTVRGRSVNAVPGSVRRRISGHPPAAGRPVTRSGYQPA